MVRSCESRDILDSGAMVVEKILDVEEIDTDIADEVGSEENPYLRLCSKIHFLIEKILGRHRGQWRRRTLTTGYPS